MGKVHFTTLMDPFTKEIGQMTKSLAKENIPIPTVIFTKVNGKMICDMELALILTNQTALSMLEIGRKGKPKVVANLFIKIIDTREAGINQKCMGLENIFSISAANNTENIFLLYGMRVKRKKKKLKWSSQNGKLPESRQSRSKRLPRLKTIKYYQI